uniref:Mitochondrial fission process protein 1 n=1 Tax=Coturnix japonica TaxID=93934 RepID=A0A8C2YDD9_COTJA
MSALAARPLMRPHQFLPHLPSLASISAPSPPVPTAASIPISIPIPVSHPVPAALRAVPARPPVPGTVQGRHRALEAAQGGAASPSSIPAALKRRRRGRGAGTMSGRVGELSPRQAEALAQFRESIKDVLPSLPSQDDYFLLKWLRGYANEVGESFRSVVPVAAVWASYGVATAYVTADAIDKGRRAAEAHAQDPNRAQRVGVAVADTFVWQSLASVAIPGFTINRLCAASLALMGSFTRWPLPVRKWATTALGLAAIPVIITPIDRSVDFLMDSSIRKLYGTDEPPSAP